jgi:hypothetical protein
MRKRVIAQIGLAVLLVSCLCPRFIVLAQAAASATAQQKKESGTDYPYPRHLNLPINSDPLSIISFTLFPEDNGNGSSTTTNYLAVLDTGGGLHILRTTADGKLEIEFTLRGPKTENWSRLSSFPSDAYPGVIVLGGYSEDSEYGAYSTAAVCFVHGKFRVVYRGDQADFVHISRFDMPEVIQYTENEEDDQTGNYYATRVRIWTWVGMQYKQVIEIPYKERFSPQVLHAIRKVQEQGKTLPAPLQRTMPQ